VDRHPKEDLVVSTVLSCYSDLESLLETKYGRATIEKDDSVLKVVIKTAEWHMTGGKILLVGLWAASGSCGILYSRHNPKADKL
jgi:hypothetical protein